MVREDQFEISRNERTTFGGVTLTGQNENYFSICTKLQVLLCANAPIIAPPGKFFDLPMRLQVWNEPKKKKKKKSPSIWHEKVSGISNLKVWLNGGRCWEELYIPVIKHVKRCWTLLKTLVSTCTGCLINIF